MASGREPARERERLMVQLHPWTGERLAKETLRQPAAQDTIAYGYLGDMQLRLVFDEPGVASAAAVQNFKDIEVVGINDLLEPDYLAYMLQYDSVHGRFKGDISIDNNTLIVNLSLIHI